MQKGGKMDSVSTQNDSVFYSYSTFWYQSSVQVPELDFWHQFVKVSECGTLSGEIKMQRRVSFLLDQIWVELQVRILEQVKKYHHLMTNC